MAVPATEVHADQVPSLGVVVFPVRVSKVSDVPAGWLLSEVKLSQCTAVLASNRRDTKTPDEAYGLMRSQSIDKVGPPAKSLPNGRMLAVMAMACDATCTPSME